MLPSMTGVCPYLCTADGLDLLVAEIDAANGCCAVSADQPAEIPLDFQGSTCLTAGFGRCSRYKAAMKQAAAPPDRRLLILGGGLGLFVIVSICAIVLGLALALRAAGITTSEAEANQTGTAAAMLTSSATLTPTVTVAPTVISIAPTVTPTPTPTSRPTRTATPSPTSSPTTLFFSPVDTPTPSSTPTRTPTSSWRPPPTATLAPTATRTPTATGSPTTTRTPTATATTVAVCGTGDTMIFEPATPAPSKLFAIRVKSTSPYADVSLTGGSRPQYKGLSRDGTLYVWSWEDDIDTEGTYTYSFKIKSGAKECKTGSVTIAVPTETPTPTLTPSMTPTPSDTPTITPTPTATPFYSFILSSFAPDYVSIDPPAAVVEVTFLSTLTHLGNRTNTYRIWAEDHTPAGWTLHFCIGATCYDAAPAQEITLDPGAAGVELSLKITVPAGALSGAEGFGVLRVQLIANGATQSQTGTVHVK